MSDENEKNISEQTRHTGPISLSEGLAPIVKKLLGRKGFLQSDLFYEWKHIVGEETSSYSLPQKLTFKKGEQTDGTLFIAVPSGVFATELLHRKLSLIEKINTYFGYKAVSELRFSVNDAFFADEDDKSIKNADKQEKTLVTSEQKKYITELTEGISNNDLKNCLQRLGESIFKNK
jgi:hypothetical protein